MRNALRGFYPPSDAELSAIWSSGLVILDANALLNLFRYSDATRDDFLKTLHRFRDQLWIPHQVGLEFQRNRLEVIRQQERAFDEIAASLESSRSTFRQALQKFRKHPSIDTSNLGAELERKLNDVAELLEESREDHKKRYSEGDQSDRIFNRITDLYDGRVGDGYDESQLAQLHREGAARFERKLPPGFSDSKKPEPERYGDLVVWRQILDEARSAKRPAIFVTDDAKEDWWYIVGGRTHGPRVELIDEYFAASGARVHFYSPERFVEYAKENYSTDVRAETVSEIESVSSTRVDEENRASRAWLAYERWVEQELRHSEAGGAPEDFDHLRAEISPAVRRRLAARVRELESVNHGVRHAVERLLTSDLVERERWNAQFDALTKRRSELEQEIAALRDASPALWPANWLPHASAGESDYLLLPDLPDEREPNNLPTA